MRTARTAAILCLALASGAAHAQSAQRAVFVANNGNLEGSVSSFLVNPDGTVTFRQKVVLGSRPSTQVFHPGTNCQTIDITPGGRFLAAGHGTSSTTVEQLSILEIAPDQTMTVFALFTVPDSPLGVRWVTDTLLAVTRTSGSPFNSTDLYLFNPAADAPTLTLVDSEPTGSFSTSLAAHLPTRTVFSQTTGTSAIYTFTASESGLTPAIFNPSLTPCYPLGLGLSPDGTRVYAGGGISAGSHAVFGGTYVLTGSVVPMSGAPFFSPGTSPKQVVISSNNAYAFVAHGTDSTVRSFAIDPSGALTPTGFSRTVGIQGSLGEVGVLDNLVMILDRDTISDGVRGLISCTMQPDGSFPINGTIQDTTGITPYALAVWRGLCPGDANGDGVVDFADLNLVISNFGQSGAPGAVPGDVNRDGVVNFVDLNLVIGAFGTEC